MLRTRRIIFFELLFLWMLVLTFASSAATYSSFWKQDASGSWHVYDGSGVMVKNAWVCDDAVSSNGKNIWYLIDADGSMISAGLVQDNTGNYYSLEMNHDGYYGMLRYESGSYTADGLTVSLQLEGSHNGSFAAIQNDGGIRALKAKYGLKKVSVDNSNCVYTSAFVSTKTAAEETNDAAGEEETENKNVLTAKDFTVSGRSVPQSDMISYISANYGSDSAAFFYYDASSDPSRAGVVKTYRGITLTDNKSKVISAYGEGTAVDVSSPSSTRALDVVYHFDPNGLKKYAKSCLAYFTEDGEYAIYFCFKDSGQLSYIIYYCS